MNLCSLSSNVSDFNIAFGLELGLSQKCLEFTGSFLRMLGTRWRLKQNKLAPFFRLKNLCFAVSWEILLSCKYVFQWSQ